MTKRKFEEDVPGWDDFITNPAKRRRLNTQVAPAVPPVAPAVPPVAPAVPPVAPAVPPVAPRVRERLGKLFRPLTDRNAMSPQDVQRLANDNGNFYGFDPRKIKQFAVDYDATPLEGREAFIKERSETRKRSQLGKELGRFTIEALGRPGNLDKVILKDGLVSNRGAARGYFDHPTNSIYLDPAKHTGHTGKDILSTIVHEGNHALEFQKPFVKNTLEEFLREKLDKSEPMEAGYIPQLYKGMQDIINFPPREFADLYKANRPNQLKEITPALLNETPHGLHGLEFYFDEIPTFALESLMREETPWINNPDKNPDSRKLLRRLMKDTHQLYRDQGLVDKNQPLEGFLPYKYKRSQVPRYNLSVETEGSKEGEPKYRTLNDALIDKIEYLRKPPQSSQSSSSSSLSSSSSGAGTSAPIWNSTSSSSPFSSSSPSLGASSSSVFGPRTPSGPPSSFSSAGGYGASGSQLLSSRSSPFSSSSSSSSPSSSSFPNSLGASSSSVFDPRTPSGPPSSSSSSSGYGSYVTAPSSSSSSSPYFSSSASPAQGGENVYPPWGFFNQTSYKELLKQSGLEENPRRS